MVIFSMTKEEELNSKIQELEKAKNELIERIKELNKRLRYKKYEQKALEPFLEETKNVRTGPLRKHKRDLEFRISTQAYTPQIERELLKEMKKVDSELEKMREIEWARKKKRLVEQDVEEANKEILSIEEKLKTIREELKQLYDNIKTIRSATKRGVKFGGFEDEMLTLGDIGIIEKE